VSQSGASGGACSFLLREFLNTLASLSAYPRLRVLFCYKAVFLTFDDNLGLIYRAIRDLFNRLVHFHAPVWRFVSLLLVSTR
jgi:hypothetical protein